MFGNMDFPEKYFFITMAQPMFSFHNAPLSKITDCRDTIQNTGKALLQP
jgi:hypothetical protein